MVVGREQTAPGDKYALAFPSTDRSNSSSAAHKYKFEILMFWSPT